MNLLHLDSSVLGDGSVTRELSAATVAGLRREQPSIEVVRRDLSADPLPHYDTVNLLGRQPAADWSSVDAAGRAELERSQAVLDEFLAADVIVIGAPMYNFGVPSQLKAWIDRIAVSGKTFRYSATGPVGLAGGKRVIVLSARGGFYSSGPNAAADFQEAYLTQVFRFLGITDIEFVRAEGIGMGAEARAKAVNAALERIAGEQRLAA